MYIGQWGQMVKLLDIWCVNSLYASKPIYWIPIDRILNEMISKLCNSIVENLFCFSLSHHRHRYHHKFKLQTIFVTHNDKIDSVLIFQSLKINFGILYSFRNFIIEKIFDGGWKETENRSQESEKKNAISSYQIQAHCGDGNERS